uniref:tRNA (uracil-O(2)-)-methyltransferase n=1 Tax=Parastrongyloides trichosuri TaxID=131310 RepID=A0A0N4ZY53_PARTI
MDELTILCECTIDSMEEEEILRRFTTLIDMWRFQAHCINRRLSSAGVVTHDDVLKIESLPTKYKSECYLVQKLIPRSKVFSHEIYQFSKYLNSKSCIFECINLNNKLKHSHVDVWYQIRIDEESGCNKLQILVKKGTDENKCAWLVDVAFPRFEKWFKSHVDVWYQIRIDEESGCNKLQILVKKGTDENKCAWLVDVAFPRFEKWFKSVDLEKEIVPMESLINTENYALKYRDIKENIGKEIVETWTEKTDPLKFVYEDCGISAYLSELWKTFNEVPKCFVDVGCGNGLLSYILGKEGYKGIGIDLRSRKIWKKFIDDGCNLIEKTLVPSSNDRNSIGIPKECDFLIGNHSDELTPWIPIMASRLKCNFFLLPCCPFDFYGKFIRLPNEFVKKNDKIFGAQGTSLYNNYLSYLKCLCEKLGYNVKVDRLRIPSTKRIALICTIPLDGLGDNLENIIESILEVCKRNKNNIFVPRNKIEAVRNCSQIEVTVRNRIIERIFNKLLSIDKDALYLSKWHVGGSLTILELFKMLNNDEKSLMKNQNGGFQTFLKNQHQIFKIHSGKVFIKNWAQEIKITKIKKEHLHKTECWFHRYHPDGCPLSKEKCLFIH